MSRFEITERVLNLQETYRIEAENQTREKESLIDLLQQQIDGLKRDTVQTEEQVSGLIFDNESLRKEKIENEKIYTTNINQLKEVNQKNNEIIANYNEKIDTLSGLVNEYKGYVDENKVLKQEIVDMQRVNEKLQQENEKLNISLNEKERQIQTMQTDNKNRLDELTEKHLEDITRLREKFELEKDRALLEQREKYNKELDEIRDMYQDKINQLLQIKPKREVKNKTESSTQA